MNDKKPADEHRPETDRSPDAASVDAPQPVSGHTPGASSGIGNPEGHSYHPGGDSVAAVRDASPDGESPEDRVVNRRDFVKSVAVMAGVAAATATALSPLRHLDDFPSVEEFLQKHYKEMTPEDKEAVFERIRKQVKEKYGVIPNVRDPQPMDGVQFAYALNIGRCIGCRKCVYACAKENNCSQNPQIQYIRVLKMNKGAINLESAEHDYDDASVPSDDHFYMPVQCHQCENPPCVKVCPVQATWREKDGIVVIDYDWCIGCRYCEAACPYWARRFNFGKPDLPQERLNPDMGYLSNRPRHKGVMEKCTFCLHRTREGKYPACVEVCPTGSRKFGNVLDPESEISKILKEKWVYILKEDLGTIPRFYYYFDSGAFPYRG